MTINLGKFTLLDWYFSHQPVEYNLFTTDVDELTLSELKQFPKNFPLGSSNFKNYHDRFVELLAEIYKVDTNEILVTCGAREANFLLQASLLTKNDPVVLENPTYTPLWDMAKALSGKLSYLKRNFENDFQIDMDDAITKINKSTRLVILTDLHNPSGHPLENKKKLVDFCKDLGVPIHFDEIYLGCGNKTNSSAAKYGGIITSSFTKCFGGSGLRLGWIIGPSDIIKNLYDLKLMTSVSVAVPSLFLGIQLLEHWNDLMVRAGKILQKRLDLVKKWHEKEKDVIEISKSDGAGLTLVKLPFNDDLDFASKLYTREKTLVAPGSYFGMPGTIRVGLGAPSHVIEKGLEKISSLVKSLSND